MSFKNFRCPLINTFKYQISLVSTPINVGLGSTLNTLWIYVEKYFVSNPYNTNLFILELLYKLISKREILYYDTWFWQNLS